MASKKAERPAMQVNITYPTEAAGYDVYEQIGRGAFAKVYPAKLKKSQIEVAIKILDVSADDPNWDALKDEISTLRELKHENVIDVFTSFSESDTLWIVTPLLGAGSCADIMRLVRQQGFKDEALIATILQGALKALVYLHGLSKIHRDVKAGNILVSNQGQVKLADFGVSGTMMHGGKMRECRTFTGSPCWMAPEVMEQSDGYDAKADIWSFGITAMELAFGRAPYSNFKPMKIILLTLQEDPPSIDNYENTNKKISKDFNKLMVACLKKSPKDRITASDLLKKSFFKKAKTEKYVEDQIKAMFKESPPRNLFKTKVDIVTVRTEQRKEEDKPVSFRQSFVFTANVDELRDIRQGRKSTFARQDDEGDFDQDMEVPKESSDGEIEEGEGKAKTGRFEVVDVNTAEGGEDGEGEDEEEKDPQVKVGRFLIESSDNAELGEQNVEEAENGGEAKNDEEAENGGEENGGVSLEESSSQTVTKKKGRFVVEEEIHEEQPDDAGTDEFTVGEQPDDDGEQPDDAEEMEGKESQGQEGSLTEDREGNSPTGGEGSPVAGVTQKKGRFTVEEGNDEDKENNIG